MIPRLAKEAPKGVELAVSLNAADDELRGRLMPGVARWTIAELLAACNEWTNLRGGQPVTYAYVLLEGVNDRRDDAARLAKLFLPPATPPQPHPHEPGEGSSFPQAAARPPQPSPRG